MLKTRRSGQSEQHKFPELRIGLPEDPRPFVGSEHLAAAALLQQHLTARCLVAVVGRLGTGKSTVCLRAANSRWARQWFLQDEGGQPVHRRFWVDLEDCRPGPETRQKIAHSLGCVNFDDALLRLGNGKPCLLILDNADGAFLDRGDGDEGDTMGDMVACVARGASVVVTRRRVDDLRLDRPWTDVIEVSELGYHDEARQLFDELASRHASDFRVDDIVAACSRLPLALHLLGRVASASDLEAARIRGGSGIDGPRGLDFALEVATVTLDADDRTVWAALSQFPSGLTSDDLPAIVPAIANAQERTIRLYEVGVVQRCEAGVRVPIPLRLPSSAAGLVTADIEDLWRNYVRRARAVAEAGGVAAEAAGGAAGQAAANALADATDRARSVADDRAHRALRAARKESQAADRWLTRQVANLSRLAARDPLPDGTVDLANAGLLIHASGVAPDLVDRVLVQLAIDAMGDSIPATLALTAATLEDQRRFGTSALLATALVEGHRRLGETVDEAGVLCQLGRAERFQGRYDFAKAHLRDARSRYQQLDDYVGEGSALFELGQIDLERGHLDDAEEHLEAALSRFAAHGRPVGEANVNLDLVRVDLARGRLDRAERRLNDALDRYQQAGHKLGSANACLQLGQLDLARGHLEDAEREFGQALDSYEQVGDKVGFANACLQLGQVDLARGRLGNAERRFGAALFGYERVGDLVGRANASLQLGQIDLARGRLAGASARLSEALSAYRDLGDQIGLANSSLQLGQVHLARGELREADQCLSSAQSIYDEIGDRLGSANSRQLEAILRQNQHRPSAAMALYGEASRLYASLGRTASAGWSLAGAARVCTGRAERHGYTADAVRLLTEAGMTAAAAKVAAEFAEPDPPEPEPEVAAPEPEAAAAKLQGAAPEPEPAAATLQGAAPEPEPVPPEPEPVPPEPAPVQPGHEELGSVPEPAGAEVPPESVPESGAEPAPVVEAEAEAVPMPVAEWAPESVLEPEPEPEPVVDAEAVPMPVGEWAPESVLESGPEPPPASVAEPQTETVHEPDSEPTSELEPAPAPVAKPTRLPGRESERGRERPPKRESEPTEPIPVVASHDERMWDRVVDRQVQWGSIDPRELIRVAHGDAVIEPGPPAPERSDDEAADIRDPRRKLRFRLGRKKDRAPDPPTLPGL